MTGYGLNMTEHVVQSSHPSFCHCHLAKGSILGLHLEWAPHSPHVSVTSTCREMISFSMFLFQRPPHPRFTWIWIIKKQIASFSLSLFLSLSIAFSRSSSLLSLMFYVDSWHFLSDWNSPGPHHSDKHSACKASSSERTLYSSAAVRRANSPFQGRWPWRFDMMLPAQRVKPGRLSVKALWRTWWNYVKTWENMSWSV